MNRLPPPLYYFTSEKKKKEINIKNTETSTRKI